jgi:hypothetical protein
VPGLDYLIAIETMSASVVPIRAWGRPAEDVEDDAQGDIPQPPEPADRTAVDAA